jgi:hypothetical protein
MCLPLNVVGMLLFKPYKPQHNTHWLRANATLDSCTSLTGRDVCVVYWRVVVSCQLHDMAKDGAAAVTRQVEVAVAGNVHCMWQAVSNLHQQQPQCAEVAAQFQTAGTSNAPAKITVTSSAV